VDTTKTPGVWTTERLRLYVANHYLERKERAGDPIDGLPHEGTDMEIFERFFSTRRYVAVGFLRVVRSSGHTLAWRIFEPTEHVEEPTARGKETTTVDQALLKEHDQVLPKGPNQGPPKVLEQEPVEGVKQALAKVSEQIPPTGPVQELPKVLDRSRLRAPGVEQALTKVREQIPPKEPVQETPKVPEQEPLKGVEQGPTKGPKQTSPKEARMTTSSFDYDTVPCSCAGRCVPRHQVSVSIHSLHRWAREVKRRWRRRGLPAHSGHQRLRGDGQHCQHWARFPGDLSTVYGTRSDECLDAREQGCLGRLYAESHDHVPS
jgi:hypothetical protein